MESKYWIIGLALWLVLTGGCVQQQNQQQTQETTIKDTIIPTSTTHTTIQTTIHTTTTTSTTTTTILSTTTTTQARRYTITIKNSDFNPSPLTVSVGATVTWVNEDFAHHSIKSDNFNSRSLSKGDSFEFKFNDTGTHNYICGIHPSMKGKIIVE